MISGKKLGLISLATSALVLVFVIMIFQGADILVAWIVGSFICTLLFIVILCIPALFLQFSPSNRKQYLAAMRRAQSQCVQCSYDLRAHKAGDKCPECGTPIPPINSATISADQRSPS